MILTKAFFHVSVVFCNFSNIRVLCAEVAQR